MTTTAHHPQEVAARTLGARPLETAGRHREERRKRRSLASDGLYVAAWASLALPIALFLADGGASYFSSFSGALTGLGIIAGLVATDALVIMLVLAARLPVIDRTIGQDKAIDIHAKLGQMTFGGLVAHALLLLSGYSLRSGRGLVGELASLWRSGDFVLAVAGLGLLTLVAVTSVVAVKRQLPYEVWHGIHLASYVAVGVSLPHQFSLSGLFAEGPSRWYWQGLLAIAGFALLAYRVLLPFLVSLDHRLVVSRVVREAEDVVSIEVTGRRIHELEAQGGQYFHWRFLAPGLWWHQHPFSVSASPSADTLRITVRNLGHGTARLMNVQPGTKVAIEGPYGVFSERSRTASDVVLVGLGIGIAPIRALLEEADFEPGHGTVILRNSRPSEVYLLHEIDYLCARKGARLVVLTGPRGRYSDGTASWLPQQAQHLRLTDLVGDLSQADLYVCGPQAATELVIRDARAAGVLPERIHREQFSW